MLVATTVLAVLWPWRAWEFSANASDLIATYVETPSPATLPEIHRDMALHRSASYACNARQLRRLHSIFAAGLIGLAAELAAWGVALVRPRLDCSHGQQVVGASSTEADPDTAEPNAG